MRSMNAMKLVVSAGYVPSLEVLPFLAWAPESGIKLQSCPGYGNMVRALLKGDLQVRLLPWELFVTDLLSLPGQSRVWKVPAVLKTCPMELALSRSAWKQVASSKRRARTAGSLGLVFGVEARHSFTKHQIMSWIAGLRVPHVGSPVFRVLPMNLMIKALKLGEVDGVLAPSPWGLQAELDGIGKIDPSFDSGEYAQHLVLVCREEVSVRMYDLLENLPARLRDTNALDRGSEAFEKWSMYLSSGVNPGLSRELFDLAARQYPLGSLPDEFIPDLKWFERELEHLVGRRVLTMKSSSITEIAKALVH